MLKEGKRCRKCKEGCRKSWKREGGEGKRAVEGEGGETSE